MTVSFEGASNLAKNEFSSLKRTRIAVLPEVRDYLLLQSLDGRIRAGHGNFRGRAMPNISFEEVCCLVNRDPDKVKQKRQELVDSVDGFITGVLSGARSYFTDRSGFPVYGISFLANKKSVQYPKQALKGAVLASFMDSNYYRERTIERYDSRDLRDKLLEVGYGEELLVNLAKMDEFGITRDALSHGEWNRSWLEDIGVCVPELGKGITNLFVRYREGLGVCDDAALLTIGKIYGPEAMLFGYLIDATDTYSKHISRPVNGGVDEAIGKKLQETWIDLYNEPLVSDEEIMRIIYLGAKDNFPRLVFSSSHRRFCEHEYIEREDRFSERPTILNHVNFLYRDNNPRNYRFRLGFDRFPANNFYQIMKQRWNVYDKKHGLPNEVKNPQYSEVLLN